MNNFDQSRATGPSNFGPHNAGAGALAGSKGEALVAQLLQSGERSIGAGFLAEVFRTQLSEEKFDIAHFSSNTKNKILRTLLSPQARGENEDLVSMLIWDPTWPVGLDADTSLLAAAWLLDKAQGDPRSTWLSPLRRLTTALEASWHEDSLPRGARLRLVNFAKNLVARWGDEGLNLHPFLASLVTLSAHRHEDIIESILELKPGEEQLLSKLSRAPGEKLALRNVLIEVLQDPTLPQFNKTLVVQWFFEGSLRSCLAKRDNLTLVQTLAFSLVPLIDASLALNLWKTMTAEAETLHRPLQKGPREGIEQEILFSYIGIAKAFLYLYGRRSQTHKQVWENLVPKLRSLSRVQTSAGGQGLSREDLVWFEMLSAPNGTWQEGLGKSPAWIQTLSQELASQIFAMAPGYWIELYGSHLLESLYKSTRQAGFVATEEHLKCLQFMLKCAWNKTKKFSTRMESWLAAEALEPSTRSEEINIELQRREQAGLLEGNVAVEVWKKFRNRARASLGERIHAGLFLFLCSLQN